MEKVLGDGNDIAGKDAHTGNLVHVAIQAFHLAGNKQSAGVDAINNSIKVYSEGDPEEAKRLYEKYCKREVSERRGEVIFCEEKVEVEIPPSRFDPTKEKIVIHGTVDLGRAIGRDTIYVIDHKTGRKPGADMVTYYAPQIAVYMLGVMRRYPEKKIVGFITRIQDLCRINLPYWWKMPFEGEDAVMRVLQVVQTRIAVLRMEEYEHTPGKHCDWCPLRNYPHCNAMPLGSRPQPASTELAEKIQAARTPKPRVSLDTLFGK